ncbi:DNA polymerase IV [Sulfuricurvum sp.]|uniref:DNA polymerase Y family protein n=1 Tax=Sulfuricurvum sp. TaxID=2025608 RepID=UPI0026057644|nr:DNA polymerase IV [Sulfuricurvum sp.]MDD2267696.1 DNA polymerase IV [Sulfuricurvum sp.]MDD2949176.1 DNA polymerase IV [Sulfuricurvum sp.]
MIIHLDLDCYFVSAERTRTPYLKGKPVVVVKSSDRAIFSSKDTKSVMTESVGAFTSLFQHEREWQEFNPTHWKKEFMDEQGRVHGIVIARSYECKSYGIKTGTTLSDAMRMCPDLLVVQGDHLFYQLLSTKLREFLQTKIPLLEQYSIDEFWGDLDGWVEDEDIHAFVSSLQAEILKKFDLPISIGASSAKWIAKLATDFNKPYGITIVPKEEIEAFVSPMSINMFPGIGKVLSKRLGSYGIKTLGEVLKSAHMLQSWGRVGQDLLRRISGTDNEQVNPFHDRQSIGISRNFTATMERDEIKRRVIILSRHLSHTILKLEVNPTTYHFKLKYNGGASSGISMTIDRVFSETLLRSIAIETIIKIDNLPQYGIHSISLSASNFTSEHKPKTFSLFEAQEDEKSRRLSEQVTKLRDKYGVDILRCAIEKG